MKYEGAFPDEHGTEQELREDLRTVAEMFNLVIKRESTYGGTPTIVVDSGKEGDESEEVHIGFPHGKVFGGVVQSPSATKRIKGIPMRGAGDGAWLYEIPV